MGLLVSCTSLNFSEFFFKLLSFSFYFDNLNSIYNGIYKSNKSYQQRKN